MAGRIIARGERTWLVRVFLGRDANGKRRDHNHTVHGTKKDAQTYLNGVLRDRDLGTYASVEHVTMDVLFDDLLVDYEMNGKDHAWAERIVRVHLRPHFGAMKAATIGSDEIRKYVSKRLKTGAANATVNRALALLRRAFSLGKKATPAKVGNVPDISILRENNVRKGFFEHDQFVAVRSALAEEIRPVITTAYYTGCRKAEILGLRWAQVDLAERMIRLEPGETKNDDGRMIPIASELHKVLTAQKQVRDTHWPGSPWVFSRVGEPIRNFRKAWDSACKSAGLSVKVGDRERPSRLFHDLRRTGVRNLIRAGVPERVAMTISGHKTRAVFDRYNIVGESDLREAARRLGDYLTQKSDR